MLSGGPGSVEPAAGGRPQSSRTSYDAGVARRALLFGAVTALVACSSQPSFGGGDGGSTGADTGTGSLAASTGTAGGDDPGSGGSTSTSSIPATTSTTSSSGSGGEGGGTSTGGGGGGGGDAAGGAGPCLLASDCPSARGPCVLPDCDEDTGICGEAARPAGAEGGDCGVCQGGIHAGVCGLRLWTRAFPADGAWTSILISDEWNHANAPPPGGIDEAEHTRELGRLMVWASDGMFYERVGDDWLPPVSASVRFPGWPVDARVGAAVIWKPEAEVASETIFLTTRTAPLTAHAFDIDGTGAITSAGDPEVIEAHADPDAPPQDSQPFDWAFAEQRGYIFESLDWVVFWEGLGGTVYEYWGGNDDFVSSEPDATSVLSMDGMAAPAPGTVEAAWLEDTTLHVLAP